MYKYSGVSYSIVRQTLPALKSTVIRDFIDIGIEAGLYTENNHNLTDKEYRHNGNFLDYFSADDNEKIRGRKRDVLYLNEGPELTWDVVQQLLWRTTAKIIIDYNPSYPESWVYDHILTRKDCAFIVTTYKDNPHLSPGQLSEIEWMRINDPDTYRIYGLGQRGELRGQIYKNWKRIKELPVEYPSTFVIDFGFANDPLCISEFKHHNRSIFTKNYIYLTDQDNLDCAIHLYMLGCTDESHIIADSAEPKAIAELRRGWDLNEEGLRDKMLNFDGVFNRAVNKGVMTREQADDMISRYQSCDIRKMQQVLLNGFSIEGALKGQDSIDAGIQKVKQYEMFVTEDSHNAWREYTQYRWKEDPKTNKLLNVPTGENHHCDCARYYTVTLY